MPSKWAMVDSSLPALDETKSPAQQARELVNYMYILVEELKYQLNNLDAGNWNRQALEELQIDTTADLVAKVSGVAMKLDALTGEVRAITGRMGALDELEKRIAEAEAATEELTEELAVLAGLVDGQGAALFDLEQGIGRMESLLTPDGEGGGILGNEGKVLHLRGKVYINGKMITGEETT